MNPLLRKLFAQFGLSTDRQANLSRLARFTRDDLGEFERVLVEAAERIDDAADLSELAEVVNIVRDVAADLGSPEGESDGPEGETEAEPAPIAADARPTPRRMILSRPRDARPRARDEGVGLVAAASGRPVGSTADLADEFSAAVRELSGDRAFSGRRTVVRTSWSDQYPEDRRLGGDAVENMRRIGAVARWEAAEERLDALAGGRDRLAALAGLNANGGRGLVAAGGLCGPTNVKADFLGIGSTVRALRDSLPSFDASRGGVHLLSPVQLEDVSGAVTIHTEADDVAGSSKNVLTITCPEEISVNVSAIAARARLGNFVGQFNEPFAARVLGLVAQSHARQAEDQLWDQMCSATGVLTKTSGDLELGAARDVISDIARAAEQLRARHRVPMDGLVEARLPSWVWSAMRVDLLRQLPGDATLGTADAQIAGSFAEFSIAVTAVLDAGSSNQDFQDPIGDGGPLIGWPGTAEVLVSLPGSFVFLDGGTIDAGIVRDSTLNALNNFETFFETFEEVVHVAPESICLTVNSCPTGQTSATVDMSGTCASGS